jgi:hypothetical protein
LNLGKHGGRQCKNRRTNSPGLHEEHWSAPGKYDIEDNITEQKLIQIMPKNQG